MIPYTLFSPSQDTIAKYTKSSKRTKDGWVKYYDIACAFDTETTSFLSGDEKCSYCYVWQMCIDGVTVYGRTLDEFKSFCETLARLFQLSDKVRLIVYVHNLEFDFQFIRKYFNWIDYFAREERKPLYICNEFGIEFRCSYMLSGLSLAKVGENLQNSTVRKLVGDLDYTLLRHSATPLTEKELQYCENDVIVLCEFIRDEMAKNAGKIANIPLTKTGYVRRQCRQALQADKEFWKKYKRKLDKCQPDENLFVLLHKAYQGGYTHANSVYVDMVLDDVKSIDFASSYPTQMCCKKFPWRFSQVDVTDIEMFEHFIAHSACVFEVSFRNLRAKRTTTILSSSKCEILENAVIDNGRVYSCDYCQTYITELDWKSLNDFYDFDEYEVGDFWVSKYEPLPKPLVETVLKCYSVKTELKGVPGKEQEYQVAKGVINGVYGMCVTNPVCDTIEYDNDDWSATPPTITECLDELVTNKGTFLLYQWGVWVSAWARYELLRFVNRIETEVGNSVVYCDTDSIKYIHSPQIDTLVAQYNDKQIDTFKAIAHQYNYTIPSTQGGTKAYLGVFDDDGDYTKFKTLGAKRYVYTATNKQGKQEFKITIAGLGKKAGGDYIAGQADPFKFFSDGMTIPPENTGKKTRTYIDDEITVRLTDYCGNTIIVNAPSGVHLETCGFEMSLANGYRQLFTTIQETTNTGRTIDDKVQDDLMLGIKSRVDNLRSELFNGEKK